MICAMSSSLKSEVLANERARDRPRRGFAAQPDSRIFRISASLSWCVKLSHSCRPMILDFPFLVKPNSGEIRISRPHPIGRGSFAVTRKPFAIPRFTAIWSTRFAGQIALRFPWSAPSRIREMGRSNSDRQRTPGNGGPPEVKEYTQTAAVWPGHGRRNPCLSDEAALIRISPEFGLTRKGKSRIIGRQE